MAISVEACGMTTAIGLTGPASCAALRARLDNFQETRFISRDGVWILGAEVPLEEPWRGLARHTQLLKGPLEECFNACADVSPEDIPVLFCVAEKERSGRIADLETRLGQEMVSLLGHGLHPASRTIAYGQVAGAVGLRDARKLIESGEVPFVILAGVDSFLLAQTLRAYDQTDRLLTEENSDGFIPGEAGAAVVLGPSRGRGLALIGLGFGAEEAAIGSGQPLRADGLMSAMSQSLDEAGIALNQVHYRIADLSGEQYYFKEAALAHTRLFRGTEDVEDIWHPADGFGYTGAAAIPLMLGVSLTAGQKDYAPGPVVLAHAAHDDGRRAAMILRMEGG